VLVKLNGEDALREFALRALAGKKGDSTIPIARSRGAEDSNPRVRVMAGVGLNRLAGQRA